MDEYRVVSLFSGCGGFDIGFEKNGFKTDYACDIDEYSVRKYNLNVANVAELADVTDKSFKKRIKSLKTTDVVIGGFPCQGFSKSGPKRADDSRNQLYLEMLYTVKTLKPKLFVAENVDGMSQNYGGKFIELIQSDFSELGYNVEFRILNAARFGAPQHRRRIIFVGTKKNLKRDFIWPAATHSVKTRNGEFEISDSLPLFDTDTTEPMRNPATIRDAIADLPEHESLPIDHVTTNNWPKHYLDIFDRIGPGQKLCNVRFSNTSIYTWNIPKVFGKTSKKEKIILEAIGKNRRHKKYGDIPNGNPLSVATIKALTGLQSVVDEIRSLEEKNYLQRKNGKYDLKGAMFCSGLFKRPHWDEPSPTVLTVHENPRYFLHPEKNRPFTVRECARIQGFPDDYKFLEEGSKKEIKDAYKAIGNAVPFHLASVIASSAHSYLSNNQ